MDLEQARHNMIEQQIRPWNVLDQQVLDTLSIIKREHFVPEALKNLAFVDTALPLPQKQSMLSPKVEAHILQAVKPQKHEQVLEIGAGSGYLSALLAYHAQSVTSIEIFPELVEFARRNLSKSYIDNVNVIAGNGARGWAGSYDVICISGSLVTLPHIFLNQLNVGGRIFAFIGEAPVITAQLITRTAIDHYSHSTLFETYVEPLINVPYSSRFVF
jgi:protein-L-isoaspartate(D-aspartate) O-methyltransferase